MNNEDKYIVRKTSFEPVQNMTFESTVQRDLVLKNVDCIGKIRNTNEFLDEIRSEAELIVRQAKKEANLLRESVLSELRKLRDDLDKRVKELKEAQNTFEKNLKLLEEQRGFLESETFEKARKEGGKRGFEEGLAKGLECSAQKAEKELSARIAQGVEEKIKGERGAALLPLHKLIEEMRGVRQALLKHWEENIMQIAAAIAFQTILREPEIMHDVPLDLLREALELAMNCATLKIRMNPDDVNDLKEQIHIILEETGNLAKTEIMPDPKITRGGCLVETSLGIVDERLESRLERIVAELSE